MRVGLPEFYGPSIGFEIEQLADWLGAGRLVIKERGTATNVYKYPLDHYDKELAATAENQENPNLIDLTADYNRYYDRAGFPLRAGIEFRSSPTYLNNREASGNVEELLFMINHMEEWRIREGRRLLQEGIKSGKYAKTPSERSAEKIYLRIENWIDEYNKIAATKGYQTLLLVTPKEGKAREWCLELERRDIEEPTRYYTQINAAIPTKALHSPEMRKLFPHATIALEGEKEPDSWDFHVFRDHKKYLAYEESIYKQSLKLANDFFKKHLEGKVIKNHEDGQSRKLEKVQAFLRTMVYEIAMFSTTPNKLYELFNKGGTQVETRNIFGTLRKDTFPNGMMKFSLRTFFEELLTTEDRHALLKLGKGTIVQLCKDAVDLAKVHKGNGGESYLIGKTARTLDADKFYEYTFFGKTKKIYIDELETEIYPDPILRLTERVQPTSVIGLNKHQDRIKRAGVVEFRAPASGNHQIKATETLVQKSIERYDSFCARFNAQHSPAMSMSC